MIVYKNKLGITCIKPSEGYVLTRNGKTFKSVMLGINDRAEFYEEIIDENYIFEERTVEERPKDDLIKLKEELIKLSKQKVVDFINENPLFSKAKYKEGRYYNVDNEHQTRIANQLTLYQMNLIAGLKFQLTWNDVGNVAENWNFIELLNLSNEMRDYVEAIVNKQREIELLIKNASTKEELLLIKIDYNIFK